MKCPHCKSEAKKLVKETRLLDGDIVRRRECGTCGRVFGTREVVDPESTVGIGRGRNPNSNNLQNLPNLSYLWGKK